MGGAVGGGSVGGTVVGGSVTSVGSVSGVVELGDWGDVVVVDDGLGVVVVGEPASGAGAGLSGAASWTLNGFAGLPGLCAAEADDERDRTGDGRAAQSTDRTIGRSIAPGATPWHDGARAAPRAPCAGSATT